MFSKIAATLVATTYALQSGETQDLFLQDKRPSEPTQLNKNTWGSIPCQYTFDYAWYNLVNMDVIEGAADVSYYQTPKNDADEIAYFNFCRPLSFNSDEVCDGAAIFAATSTDEGKTCTADSTESQSSISSSSYINVAADGSSSKVLGILYNTTLQGADSECLLVGLICDLDQETAVLTKLRTDETQKCTQVTTMTSASVCPIYSVGAFMQLFTTYWWLFGTVCIASGVFLTFFGRALLRIVLAFIGLCVTVFLIMIIFYSTFMHDDTEDWLFWVVLVCSAILGCLVGFLLTKLVRFAGAILAAWGGFMVGMLLNEAWLYQYGFDWLFWVSCIVFAIIFFVLGFAFFEPAVIISTSFIGSYFMARGIGCFAQDASFPSVVVLIKQVQSGGIDKISPYYYAYFAGILVFTILGSFVQYKMYKKRVAKKQQVGGYAYQKMEK